MPWFWHNLLFIPTYFTATLLIFRRLALTIHSSFLLCPYRNNDKWDNETFACILPSLLSILYGSLYIWRKNVICSYATQLLIGRYVVHSPPHTSRYISCLLVSSIIIAWHPLIFRQSVNLLTLLAIPLIANTLVCQVRRPASQVRNCPLTFLLSNPLKHNFP